MGPLGETFDLDSENFDLTGDGGRILAQAVECRLDTEEGTFEDDPEYGLPLADELLDGLMPETLARLPIEVAAQLRLDPALRDATVSARATRTPADGAELHLDIGLVPHVGEPIPLTVSVDDLTVDVMLRGGA